MRNKSFSRHVLAIAKNTFRETIRDKVLYSILAFAFVYILFTLFLGSVSLGEDARVVRSLGLSGVYFFGLVITIFLGTSLLYKEIERKTLYFMLSKPVTRERILAGKFLGLFGSITCSILGMTLVYLAVVFYTGGGLDYHALYAVGFELLEVAVLIALSIFFSTFATPLASALYALLVIYIGHSLDILVNFSQNAGSFLRAFAKLFYYILPNLEKFNIRDLILYGVSPGITEIFLAAIYALLYIAVLLYLSGILFKKREL